jgi:MinD-like ATPase involved in chromosome partitioning or flagellar assembly
MGRPRHQRHRRLIQQRRGRQTTNTIQLGTCLATSLPNQRVAAIDFNAGGGALGAAAAEERQATHTMFELHRDRNQITRHSLLQPYVSSLPSGLDLLTVPPEPELALEITPEHYQQLFDELLMESYDILLLDTSPDIMNPVTRWALSSGSQLVISTEQGFMTGSVVQHALDYLLAQQAAGGGEQAIAVINKVINDARAGSADETERALKSANPAMPVIRIPYDLDLRALIDSGHYDLQHVKRRATRLPIKELTLEVCRRLI